MVIKKWVLLCSLVILILFTAGALFATPPYGDPNQPYDKLPGTWETYHVKWLKPLAEGKLKVLFIVPYPNSREVVELAQRLDLEYTVIMNAGRSGWEHGYFEGTTATPLKGVEATEILRKLSHRRLNLAHEYDVIVIGTVSWEVIPADIRELILKHVERGTGLTYVSPNRLKPGMNSNQEAAGEDPQFTNLFRTDENPPVSKNIFKSLPFDVIPLKILHSLEDFGTLRTNVPAYKLGNIKAQIPVCITTSRHGRGRVLALQYFDAKLCRGEGDNSLSPRTVYEKVMYDYSFAILAKCVRWSAGKDPAAAGEIAITAPETDLRAPVDEKLMQYCYEHKTPQMVIAGKDIEKARIRFSAVAGDETVVDLTFDYSIRTVSGRVLKQDRKQVRTSGGTARVDEIKIPVLSRGTYLVDLRVMDRNRRVLDYVSKSFRIEDNLQVTSVVTDNDRYKKGETITGEVHFSRSLGGNQKAGVRVVDTWDRIVAVADVVLSDDKKGGTFSIPIKQPVSHIWDIFGYIRDENGEIDSAMTWVAIPRQTFDDYYWGLVFCPSPGPGWKGCMYGERARQFGINGNFSGLIYGRLEEMEAVERYNMINLTYAEHRGETNNPQAHKGPWDKEFSGACLAQISRMLRYTADTGKLMDSEMFPYVFDCGSHKFTADMLRSYIEKVKYKPAGKFGTPFYTLTGEAYLSGEFQGKENSCFCELCTKNFQDWCRREFSNDLKALNAEWGSSFSSWEQVRGILLNDAVEKNQLPRWVDFRYFMRSRVWTQHFIDWTDMIRRFAPGAHTGRVGHDHYDFTRFRNHMTCSKIYNYQGVNSELRTITAEELHQSFSGDRSYLIGAQSTIRWSENFKTPRANARLPWKMLFMGFKGFDWENFLVTPTLGGMSCFTPDLSEPLPFFANISKEVMFLQKGIGNLVNTSRPLRSKVAIIWSPRNHYISRLDPFQENGFSGGWLYNANVDYGAHHDCLAMLKSLRIRGTFISPEDVINGALKERGFKALILPYSKGMSSKEASAIRSFVKQGGLVIADNTPGIYSEHGRPLEKSRVADLFPVMDKKNIISFGKGHTAYLHNEINGYLARMEASDYTGSDSVVLLLEQYAGITTPVGLLHEDNTPRRDTLMPVYLKGSAVYIGLMRQDLSDGLETMPTTMKFRQKYHVWDVRRQRYLGHVDRLKINLDMYPKFYALLLSNPQQITLSPQKEEIGQGEILSIAGRIGFNNLNKGIDTMGQAVHVRVYSPGGRELECFRDNILFDGTEFEIVLPVSYSEEPGIYSVVAEYPVTGMKVETVFEVVR